MILRLRHKWTKAKGKLSQGILYLPATSAAVHCDRNITLNLSFLVFTTERIRGNTTDSVIIWLFLLFPIVFHCFPLLTLWKRWLQWSSLSIIVLDLHEPHLGVLFPCGTDTQAERAGVAHTKLCHWSMGRLLILLVHFFPWPIPGLLSSFLPPTPLKLWHQEGKGPWKGPYSDREGPHEVSSHSLKVNLCLMAPRTSSQGQQKCSVNDLGEKREISSVYLIRGNR